MRNTYEKNPQRIGKMRGGKGIYRGQSKDELLWDVILGSGIMLSPTCLEGAIEAKSWGSITSSTNT
jgi:hypothetical protein